LCNFIPNVASKVQMENLNDTTVIENVLGGNTEAFGVLVGRYSDVVFSLVVRICGNREDAEEVTQDAFVKAYSNLSKFKGESSFPSWIYRIAYNTAISHLRKHKHMQMSELHDERLRAREEEEDGPDEFDAGSFSREEQLERLENAMAQLPPDDRALLVLFYLEDKPIREIAEIVSQTEGNVKIRLHRIRKRLAAVYEKL